MVAAHEAAKREARSRSGEEWADLDPDVAREIGERMTNRLLSAFRESGHGATLVLVPPRLAGEIAGDNPYVNLKYEFVGGEESEWRFTGLLLSIMNALARAHGRGSPESPVRVAVGWKEYLAGPLEGLRVVRAPSDGRDEVLARDPVGDPVLCALPLPLQRELDARPVEGIGGQPIVSRQGVERLEDAARRRAVCP
ncbi:MAG: hypothetical protein M3Q49_13075, partial [Actinomycetota bacterium]|nr:hypothetical protein [Actinomycetota bacterium]